MRSFSGGAQPFVCLHRRSSKTTTAFKIEGFERLIVSDHANENEILLCFALHIPLRTVRVSSDMFSCNMVATSRRKAEANASTVPCSTTTTKDLRALLCAERKTPCTTKRTQHRAGGHCGAASSQVFYSFRAHYASLYTATRWSSGTYRHIGP
jgi:hypothetical protein